MGLTHTLADNFTGANAAGVKSQWVWVGMAPVNVYMETAAGPSAFNGTVRLEASFTGEREEVAGVLDAGVDAKSVTLNYLANACVPYVRLNMTVRSTGQINRAYIVSRASSHK